MTSARDLGDLAYLTTVTTAGNISIDSNTLFVEAINNRVGIGTNGPTSNLDIVSSSSAGNLPFLSIRNTSGSTGGSFGPGITLNNGVAGTHGYVVQQYQSAASDFTISNQASPFTNYISVAQNGNVTMASNVLPLSTNTVDLGSAAQRWRNIYTQDLHLSNGIGDWTVVEGEENLYIVNNKSGKSFKFALIEVDPVEVPPKSTG